MNDELKENEKLKEELKNRPIVDFTFDTYKELEDLKEENQRLKNLCDKYEEEHNTTFKLWKMKMEEMPTYEEKIEIQKENERLKEKENKLQEKFKDWKKEIEKERKHYLCDRTDCCGRIKNSRKYNSIYQELKTCKSRCEKAIELYKNCKEKDYCILSSKMYEILIGSDENEEIEENEQEN